jgi:hypothetical protein
MPWRCMGSGCIDPHFPDLGTSWRWVVSFTPRPLYPLYPLDRRLGGPQNQSGWHGEEKISIFWWAVQIVWIPETRRDVCRLLWITKHCCNFTLSDMGIWSNSHWTAIYLKLGTFGRKSSRFTSDFQSVIACPVLISIHLSLALPGYLFPLRMLQIHPRDIWLFCKMCLLTHLTPLGAVHGGDWNFQCLCFGA